MRIAYLCMLPKCHRDYMLDAPEPIVPDKKAKGRSSWEDKVKRAVADHHKKTVPDCPATDKDFDIMLPVEALR